MRVLLVPVLLALACGGPPRSAIEAERRMLAGDLSGAEALIDRELAASPGEPHLWNVRIRVHLMRGDADRAVAAYREFRGVHGGDDREVLRAMSVTTLWRSMQGPDAEARAHAVRVAERLDLAALFDEASRLLDDEDPVVRATAAAAILRSHPDAASVLAASLSGDDARARAIAVEALSRKAGELARDDLRAALADNDAGVRSAACDALARIADKDAIARLALVASKDAEGSVRASALRALARLKTADPAPLRAALDDAYLGARLAALDALDDRLGKDASADMTRALGGKDPYLALRAGVVLARRGDRAAGLPALRAALAGEAFSLRAAALNAAPDMLAAADAAALAAPLGADPEPQVRLAAARALARTGKKAEAVEIFAAALSLAEDLRLAAATDLLHLGDARAAAALTQLAASDDATIRRGVAAAVPRRLPLADVLLGTLADSSIEVRVTAAEAVLGI